MLICLCCQVRNEVADLARIFDICQTLLSQSIERMRRAEGDLLPAGIELSANYEHSIVYLKRLQHVLPDCEVCLFNDEQVFQNVLLNTSTCTRI